MYRCSVVVCRVRTSVVGVWLLSDLDCLRSRVTQGGSQLSYVLRPIIERAVECKSAAPRAKLFFMAGNEAPGAQSSPSKVQCVSVRAPECSIMTTVLKWKLKGMF